MSDEQLERQLEDRLARLATRAVPDSQRPPAPPWREQQRRSRRADVRRFGRATPWLIAAVLLVIAGLGIGAGVAFDASGPDEAPVATDPPSPSDVVTTSGATPASTPSSHPTLSRDANGSGPDDGVGPFVVGIGSYGPVQVGMTQAQALAALGLDDGDLLPGYAASCHHAVPMPGSAGPFGEPLAIIDDEADSPTPGLVVGFLPAAGATDASGNGVGTTLGQLRASYPNGGLNKGQSWTFAVVDGAGNGLGFDLDTPVDASAPPDDSATVVALLPGTALYANGAEYCVG